MPAGWVQRFLLPGLAFKAVVIGGGYATGRELATFFLPSGPVGGLYAMLLATLVWSIVCALTFLLAYQTRSLDYRSFFRHLLGAAWPIFEVGYLAALLVILAVFAAAAGEIGRAVFGWPALAGALLLMTSIAAVAAWGNDAVERLFKYVSVLLYGTYIAFVALGVARFGDRIAAAYDAPGPIDGWVTGGLTYAGYNIIGAIVILPVVRHFVARRDAVIAGALAGPLAMLPALLFFICMVAFHPAIATAPLPSDMILGAIGLPWFRLLFQAMIFAALLESGTGGIHAINERIAAAYRTRRVRELTAPIRFAITVALLAGAVLVADRVGLVALIAEGYGWLAWLFLLIYVAPLMTIGVWQIWRGRGRPG